LSKKVEKYREILPINSFFWKMIYYYDIKSSTGPNFDIISHKNITR
jgi:hypothetical protein